MTTAQLNSTSKTIQPTRLRDLRKSVSDVVSIDPRIIDIEAGHNPRDYALKENHDHLEELKASIKKQGVRVPLLVRFDKHGGKAIVVDGECRLRACLELIDEGVPIESVPTIQVKGGNEADRLVTALTANTGKPLSKWESGNAFKRLEHFGWTPEKIAEELGFSLRFVNEALELADAPEEVKHMLSEQAVTPSLALSELRKQGTPQAIETLRQKVIEAHQKGQKTARKEQENRVPSSAQLLKLISTLIESVQDELFDGGTERYVEVDKATMRKLAKAVGIEPRVKE